MFPSGCNDYVHNFEKYSNHFIRTNLGGAYTMSLVHETNISIKNLGSFFVCFPCFRKFTYVVDDEQGKASVPNKMNLKEKKGNKYLESILRILLPTRS